MVSLQVLSKILNTKNYDIVTKNALDRDYFINYENEFDFLNDHYNNYGNIPDKETFIENFPDFEILDVTESDDYLLDKLNEEHLYTCAVPVIQKTAEILKTNSIDAVEYMIANADKLNQSVGIATTDIMKESRHRFMAYEQKKNGDENHFYIPSGFQELDYAIHGWSRGEELIVLFARTNHGKSWILAKSLSHAWRVGMNVGCISPEMSPDKLGYRVDTLLNHFDNTALNWGKEADGYEDYIEAISNSTNNFCVSIPRDFGNNITVSKVRTFIKNNNLDILGIDGITYLKDERRTKTDNGQAQLTHISQDLFDLSSELGVPIIIVVQANRDGVKINGGELEIENIRDADGISYSASKVISIRHKVDEEILELGVKKNRDGVVGGKFIYQWQPNTGDFTYIPAEDDGNNEQDRDEKIEQLRNKYEPKQGSSVF